MNAKEKLEDLMKVHGVTHEQLDHYMEALKICKQAKDLDDLTSDYEESRKKFRSLEDVVKDVDFVNDFTEEEQWFLLKMYHALDDYNDNLLKLIRQLNKDNTHHCGQDATRYAESPVITGESLQQLIDARVIAVGRTRCDKCPLGIKCPDANCVKVELVGGYYLCLMKKGGEK